MAASAPHVQKNFKLIIKDGLPEATVETIDKASWLRCCPLCGSMHQILDEKQEALYVPLCQTHAVLFKAELVAWRKLFPEVVKYSAVHLVKK